jgi:hypothetical protein
VGFATGFPACDDGGAGFQALGELRYQRQRADGGWSLTDLGTWKRVDETPLDTRPDGYATGLIVLVLEETPPRSAVEPALMHNPRGGIAWLVGQPGQDHRRVAGVVIEQERDPDPTWANS